MSLIPEAENKLIENEYSIISAEVTANGLLKVTFSDGATDYFHPDALVDLANDFADDDDIVWPIDEPEESIESIEEVNPDPNAEITEEELQ